ncbi:MAG: YIP1 family protein [Amphritea sp.]
MDDVLKKLLNNALSEFCVFFSYLPRIYSSPKEFFGSICGSHKTFYEASRFALVISCLFALLNVPSYKINGISVSSEILLIDIIFSWVLIFIYGVLVWASCKLFLGKCSLIKVLSAFFYSCAILVVIKFLEIPARIVRDKYLLGASLESDISDNMSNAVLSNPYSLVSETMVGFGYVWFSVVLFILVREVNNFNWLRSLCACLVGMFFVSLAVSWVQRPITHVLLNAFAVYN